jgi:secreted trypsin-like serine protease
MRLIHRCLVAACTAVAVSAMTTTTASAVVRPDPELSASVPDAVVSIHTAWATAPRSQFCTGTLIRRTWVLTAAHCVETFEKAADLAVVATVQGKRRVFSVNRIRMHPEYIPGDAGHGYDVALLRLVKPVPHIRPIRPVADDAAYLTGEVLLFGFGQTERTKAPRRASGTTLTLRSEGITFNPSLHIAAYADTAAGVSNACFGDSGGPILARSDTRLVLLAVVSYGAGGCDEPIPTVSTKVAPVLDWITARLASPRR